MSLICKICAFPSNQLKTIAKIEGHQMDQLLFISIPINVGNKCCYYWFLIKPSSYYVESLSLVAILYGQPCMWLQSYKQTASYGTHFRCSLEIIVRTWKLHVFRLETSRILSKFVFFKEIILKLATKIQNFTTLRLKIEFLRYKMFTAPALHCCKQNKQTECTTQTSLRVKIS